MDKVRQAGSNVDDPALRQAVLDLYRANEAFRAAYQDFERTGDARILERAGHRIDEARERVLDVQRPE